MPATGEDADLMLDYQNPPYLEADMPPAMAEEGRGGLVCLTACKQRTSVPVHARNIKTRVD